MKSTNHSERQLYGSESEKANLLDYILEGDNNPPQLEDVIFDSSDHIRFKNGRDVSGHNYGCHRRVIIQKNTEGGEGYIVTILNMDGIHPLWGDNVQMSPKRMKVIKSERNHVELRGYGYDEKALASGAPPEIASFADYGMVLTIQNEEIISAKLNLYDRDISIVYLSTSQPAPNLSPVINGHKYVDLGLSVKWAICNVGANKPEDCGDYFAWGEVLPKSVYEKENSLTYGDGSFDYDIGGKTLMDAARSNWGGSWRLPTKEECQELIDKCEWTWTTMNGVNGCVVMSQITGECIFLPVTGSLYGSFIVDSRSRGYYWSSTPVPNEDSRFGYSLNFDIGSLDMYFGLRYYGHNIRPVTD